MRGGRNKFGPMYKRDRARKLQILRQRQLALQAIRGSIGGSSADGATSQLSPTGYAPQPPYNMHIKQEIQIPQVSKNLDDPTTYGKYFNEIFNTWLLFRFHPWHLRRTRRPAQLR